MLQSEGWPAPAFYDPMRALRLAGRVGAFPCPAPFLRPADASIASRRARLHAAHARQSEQIKAGLAGLLLLCAHHPHDSRKGTTSRSDSRTSPSARRPDAVLRAFGARPLRCDEAPHLYAILLVICRRAGLRRVPELYLLPFFGMNAYALGHPGNACISVTEDLLRGLSSAEITGIFAHEVAHILHGDDHAMNWAASVQHAIEDFSSRRSFSAFSRGAHPGYWAPLLAAAPMLARMLVSALSRVREFAADLRALDLIEAPGALAEALCKLELFHTGRRPAPRAAFSGAQALNTHPETWERIAQLS